MNIDGAPNGLSPTEKVIAFVFLFLAAVSPFYTGYLANKTENSRANIAEKVLKRHNAL